MKYLYTIKDDEKTYNFDIYKIKYFALYPNEEYKNLVIRLDDENPVFFNIENKDELMEINRKIIDILNSNKMDKIETDFSLLNKALLWKIEKLEFTARVQNCLLGEGIKHVFELAMRKCDNPSSGKSPLRSIINLGKKSITEIKDVLAVQNLSLGMSFTQQELDFLGRNKE